jgi:triosephosphate isomerase (TIM)
MGIVSALIAARDPSDTLREMKKALIVANWKAYVGTPKVGLTLLKDTDKALPRGMKSKVVVCPPALLFSHLTSAYKGSRLSFGTQDISLAPNGAHTGDTTVGLAKASGATYTIIGHAERRAAGETDQSVSQKVRLALDTKMTPIVCIGERERDQHAAYLTTIESMLVESLRSVSTAELKKVVIAYEPVWAIGAQTAPDARVVREAVVYIKKILAQKFGHEAGLKATVLYGGAVDSTNAHDLLVDGQASGFLVGRASVDAKNFAGIIRACEN